MKKTKDYINLLPAEEKPAGAFNTASVAVGLFVLGWVVIFGWQMKQALDLRSRLGELAVKKQARLQELGTVQKELGITLPPGMNPEKASLVQSILSQRVAWSEVFQQFSVLVPKGLWFDSLEGSADGKAEIKIRGGAFTYLPVAEFMLAMEKSPYFEKPQLLYAQKAAVQGQDVIGFEIVCGVKTARGGR